MLIYELVSITKSIIIKLINKEIGITEKTKFLLFLFSSATSLLIATGKPNWARAIKSIKVGDISMYNPMPSVPISLAKTIFINMLINLVIAPPIISIIADLIKMFFFIFILDYICKKDRI